VAVVNSINGVLRADLINILLISCWYLKSRETTAVKKTEVNEVSGGVK
jgi:hypothetical protein